MPNCAKPGALDSPVGTLHRPVQRTLLPSMSVRRFATAILFQSLSPALLFALSLSIARLWGPAEQGAFIAGKAWLDLLVAVGCFGFPQSIVLAVNRHGASRKQLHREARLYAFVLLILFAPLTWAFAGVARGHDWGAILFAVGGAGFVLANLWRGVLLTIDDGLRFHLITSAPAVALTLAVTLTLSFGKGGLESMLPAAIGAAGVIVVALCSALIPQVMRSAGGAVSAGAAINYRRLVTDGADVFVQAISMALQTYLVVVILDHWAGAAQVGHFGMALLVYQALLMPLQMVSPLVFNRLTRAERGRGLHAGRVAEIRLLASAATFAALAAAMVPAVSALLLGAAYNEAVPAIQLLLLGVVPALFTRITALRLASSGLLRSNSLIAVARSVIAVGAVALCWRLASSLANPATVAAGALVFAEAMASMFFFYFLRRARNEQGSA